MLEHADELRRRLSGTEQSASERPLLVIGTGVSIQATAGAPAASWSGLLWLGLEKCKSLVVQRGLKRFAYEAIKDKLSTGTVEDLLDAAGSIEKLLRRAGGTIYKTWLAETLGSLSATKPDVILSLAQLDLPFCTTNYDSLIEEVLTEHTVTAWQPVLWQDHRVAESLLSGKLIGGGVLHLHGHWRESNSIILGRKSYIKLLNDQRAQVTLRDIYRNRDLIFVGMGGGLDDPNFDALLDWAAEVKPPEERFHCVLVRERDLAFFSKRLTRTMRIHVISYGQEYDDLVPFLRGLKKTASGSSNGVGAYPESLNARARWLLFETLRSDSDFEAFCLDYFPEVRRRFSNNMDRMAKANLLFELVSAGTVLNRLEASHPATLARLQASILKRKQAVWSALFRLDRYHQWGELVTSLQEASTMNRLMIVHGDDRQNIGLFVRRIEDYLAEDARCTVVHVPLRMAGATAASGAEWCKHLRQTLESALGKPVGSLSSLLERCSSDTTLVATLLAQANPLRLLKTLSAQQEEGLRAFLCEGLPSALERVRNLILLLPLEHGREEDGLLPKVRQWTEVTWQTSGRQLVELDELHLPTWNDVEKYLRTYPEPLTDRSRLMERVHTLYQSMITTQVSFETLASAVDDQILIHS